ncbi:Lrp/AsnC family transcriptional regulator [Catellatospora citrea]|uniref:Lrp/AsnC family transcriptional regulator n=1 Tax=Catellatospora citrea TaxID=53366 RepID=UPI0034118DD5
MELDPTDKALIRRLQVDGRASYTDLGQEVGLSGPAVRQRIQRLTDAGVMQIAAVTDPLKTGRPVMALLGIRVDRDAGAVAAALGELDAVVYLVATAGSFDLFAEVVCATMADLSTLVNDHVRPVPGVAAIESFPYFGIHVHRFTWGVPD